MSALRPPSALAVQPSNTPHRLDKRLDDRGSRPTVQPAPRAGVPVHAGAQGRPHAPAHPGAHVSHEVGQVGRLDEEGPKYREVMPLVWGRIVQLRQEWGAAHVAECIRRGMAGEPGWFYAFEAGHVVGTPFECNQALMQLVAAGAAMGGRYAVVMRPPVTAQGGAADGC